MRRFVNCLHLVSWLYIYYIYIYIYIFRYLDGRAFPKAQNSVGSKFYFSHWKIHFSQFIFIDKYLIFRKLNISFNILSLKHNQPYFM